VLHGTSSDVCDMRRVPVTMGRARGRMQGPTTFRVRAFGARACGRCHVS
jgi:hypothetical protein